MYARLFLILLALFSLSAKAQTIKESVAFAIIGEPKYAASFSHFDYVNPEAPKGGTLTLAAIGTFDNFNRYALRGNPAVRTEALYDTLFTTSDDEPGSYYPLIAERARYAEDYSWMEIALNPHARFHDGTPITARDVAFTFNKFMTEGVPQFRLFFKAQTQRPAVEASAGQRAIPHQRLANGAIHYLFTRRRLLGGRPAGQPGSLEFRYAAL